MSSSFYIVSHKAKPGVVFQRDVSPMYLDDEKRDALVKKEHEHGFHVHYTLPSVNGGEAFSLCETVHGKTAKDIQVFLGNFMRIIQ